MTSGMGLSVVSCQGVRVPHVEIERPDELCCTCTYICMYVILFQGTDNILLMSPLAPLSPPPSPADLFLF